MSEILQIICRMAGFARSQCQSCHWQLLRLTRWMCLHPNWEWLSKVLKTIWITVSVHILTSASFAWLRWMQASSAIKLTDCPCAEAKRVFLSLRQIWDSICILQFSNRISHRVADSLCVVIAQASSASHRDPLALPPHRCPHLQAWQSYCGLQTSIGGLPVTSKPFWLDEVKAIAQHYSSKTGT